MMTHWIIGPGAIGRLLAHSLSQNVGVTLIGRRSIPEQQTLISPDGKQHTRSFTIHTIAQLPSVPHALPDLVHLTTKAMVAEAVLKTLTTVIPPTTPLILWQNGFWAQPRITEQWPGPVLCATTTQGAYLTGDGGVVHAGHGSTFIGDLHQHHAALAAKIAQTLRGAGFITTAVDNIRQRLWQKLAVNAAINPLVALYGIRNGELRDESYARQVVAVVAEVATILQHERILPPSGVEGEAEWLALVWQVVENTANNKASMLQDVEAKRPTERRAILGPLLESAYQHGVACGILQSLDHDIAALEASYLRQ